MDIEFAIDVPCVASDGFNRYGQLARNEPTVIALCQIWKYLRLPWRQSFFQGGFAAQLVNSPQGSNSRFLLIVFATYADQRII